MRTCPVCGTALVAQRQDDPSAHVRARQRYRLKTRIYCGRACQGAAQRADPNRQAKTRAGALSYAKRIKPKTPCERCGETRMSEVHHKNRDYMDNRIENLERLCHWCHAAEHSPEYKIASVASWQTRRARYGQNGHS